MKKFFLMLCAALMLFGCDDEEEIVSNDQGMISGNVSLLSQSDAQKQFAIILSKVATKNERLRTFLKEKALEQFDKDYDVFYPFVKDAKIEEGKTFRDLLVDASSEKQITEIENSAPLLNILIPNLAAFEGFSVKKWDTSEPDVAVSYVTGNKNSVFYEDGDSLLSLSHDELPNFPCLIVKSNERMKVTGSASTRSASGNAIYQYDFADKEFDGTKRPMTRTDVYDADNPDHYEEFGPYLKPNEIDTICVSAYNEYKKDPTLIDRDYVYYGFTAKKKTNGVLRRNVYEKLYRIKVDVNAFHSISDDYSSGKKDPGIDSEEDLYHSADPGLKDAARALWTNGNFEFKFNFFDGQPGEQPESFTVDVPGDSLFHINKLHVRFTHATAFRHAKWFYSTKVEKGWLVSRWYDVSKQDQECLLRNSPWNLSTSPLSIFLSVQEFDPETTITQKYSVTTTNLNKGSFAIDANKDFVKLNAGIDYSNTVTSTKEITIASTQGSDDLGQKYISYADPLILSDSEVKTKGYKVFTYNLGSMQMIILPTVKR